MDTKHDTFRWGILGCGLIAPRFFRAVEETGEGRVVAAASTSARRAKHFQHETGVARTYSSYTAMLEHENLDAVYVATTHNFHAECARLCLEQAIPVLVEKAFTQNAPQASEIIALARERNLFLMEAMWTRFNPAITRLRELLQHEAIGHMNGFEADFCVRMGRLNPKMMPWNRMYSPRLAGGALLDLGIYPVAFARMIFGQPPSRISSSANMTWTGVDKTSRYEFDYPDGAQARMKTSFVENGSREAVIFGSKGSIRIPQFYRPDRLIIQREGKEEIRTFEEPGFAYQVREVHRCLKSGLTESPIMPLDETLETMETLDILRAQWEMKYPGE